MPRGFLTRSAIAAMPSTTVRRSVFSASVSVNPARASRNSKAWSVIAVGIRVPPFSRSHPLQSACRLAEILCGILSLSRIDEGGVIKVDGRELVLLAPVILGVLPVRPVAALRQQVHAAHQIAGVEVLRVDPRQERHVAVFRP